MSFELINLRSQENPQGEDLQFATTVLEGFSKTEKRLPSWLIFDDKGSKIFKEITELENYHPAVCEKAILQRYNKSIGNLVSPQPFRLIELGSGDGSKTQILIDHFLKNKIQFEYIPIDISLGAIENLVNLLRSKYSETILSVTGVVADYFQGLKKFIGNRSKRNFLLFLGSTIGNRDLTGAKDFLNQLSQVLRARDMIMVGFDLLKHPKILYQAYNDPQGVFEKFNMHLLERINQQLGADFNIANYFQEGSYNWRTRAVESYIYSTREQTVRIKDLNREFHFKEGEGIQTEHSYKYTLTEIEGLAEECGYEIMEHFFDNKKYFVDSVWRVK